MSLYHFFTHYHLFKNLLRICPYENIQTFSKVKRIEQLHCTDSTIIKILLHLLYVFHSAFLCWSILDQIAYLMSFHPYIFQHTALKNLTLLIWLQCHFHTWQNQLILLLSNTQHRTEFLFLSKRHQNLYNSEYIQIYTWNLPVLLLSLFC